MDQCVYIVLVNYNGIQDTIECIESIKKTTYSNYYIVVVDNASTKGDINIVKQQWDDIIVIKNDENVGFAKANNIGIKYALDHDSDLIV